MVIRRVGRLETVGGVAFAGMPRVGELHSEGTARSQAPTADLVSDGPGTEVAGDAALYIDPEDVDSIADGLSRILTDSLLREKLTAAGLARAKSFTWAETAQKTLAAYRSVL